MALDLEKIDLGSFGVNRQEAVETPVDLLDEASDVTPLDTAVRGTMSEAFKVDPDQHARNTQLSRQSGVPEFAVESDPAAVESDLKLDQIDFSGMSKRSPNTAKYLTEYNNAVIAQDDMTVLQSIEAWLKPYAETEQGEAVVQSFKRGQAVVESSEIGLNRMWADMGMADPLPEEQLLRLQELEDQMRPQDHDFNFLEGIPSATAEQLPIMGEILGTGLTYAAGGAGVGALAGTAIPGAGTLGGAIVGGKIAGRVGVAKAAFDLEAGLAHNEFRAMRDEAGNMIDPELASYAAVTVGGVNAALEFVSLAALGRTVTPAMRTLVRSRIKQSLASETGREVMKRITKDYFTAVGAESLTEALQEFTNVIGGEILKYMDEDSFTEQDLSTALDNIFSAETGERVLEAAKAGAQASILLSAPGTTASVVVDVNERQRLAENEQLKIDALNKSSIESKLKVRDNEAFKEFVREADGENNTTVFIDAVQASLYMQEKTPEQIAKDPALQLINEQLAEASALGGEVQIPVDEFAGTITGTEHFDALRPAMTMSDQTAPPFRQEQVQVETENYVQRLMAEAQENTSEYTQAQEIYETVRQQLIDTGQVQPEQAAVMADIVPAWATVHAKKNGISVEEAYRQSGLTIEGPQTGEAARLAAEAELLTQEPAFRDAPTIFTSARDKFLDVLPEDAEVEEVLEAAGEFGPEYQSFIRALERDDWLGFDFPAQAISAALSEQIDNFEVSQGLKSSIGRMVNAEFAGQRPFEQQEILDEQGRARRTTDVEQRATEQAVIQEAKGRTDRQAVAEYERAKTGEPVTFTHRSPVVFDSFDDAQLGVNSDTPSASLGHYLAAADVGNPQRYGNDLSVHRFTLQNPIVIDADTFESVAEGKSAEDFAEMRQQFMDMGHDGILVNGLNWAVVFEGQSVQKLQEDFGDLDDMFLQAPADQRETVPVDTESDAFQTWSEGGEVVESEDVNDHVFKADTPAVLKVFHGTTHKFSVFDARRGNLEGQFGAINYFTSSEQDAADNYAGEGPDLTGRIERRAEQIEFELEDTDHDSIVELSERHGLEFDPETETYPADLPEAMAREELAGGEDQVMELFVKVKNPFVIGENAEWVEFVDNEDVQERAIEVVADNNGITVEEIQAELETYEDEIDDARWEVQEESGHRLIDAINEVSARNDVEASALAAEVYDLGEEAKPEDIEQLLRSSEDYMYAEDPETGSNITSQLVAEVIEEMGFDSIILKNADDRFSTMNMEQGTAHVHIFDSNKTNIKSVENIGTFDPTDPDIFRQEEPTTEAAQDEPRGYYDPVNSVIRLNEASDLSTFLHEFAHFMYEMELQSDSDTIESINNWFKRNGEAVAKEANSYLGEEFDVLKQEGGGKSSVTITEQDVTDYLDNDTTGDRDKDVAIRRAVHEQFARGFETYLMEGKAPSIELRNAFRTFARWLAQIYRALGGNLEVNLDDGAREFFDRLLATEEQIAAAESRARYEPMFTDAAMAGMTEEEYQNYLKRQEKVKDKQTETLRDKMIKQLTRQTKAWWKEEKQDIIDEEMVTLREERVYRAADRLRAASTDDAPLVKLDHATVKEMVGEERTDKRGRTSVVIPTALRNMTAKGQQGVHPDEAAGFFGYDSGSEMLNDLITAPKIQDVAEANAERIMVERHGDILRDGTIEQAADDAVQNEERGQLIIDELKTLSRGTAQPKLDRQAFKALAEKRIGELSFREIHPGKYRKAEIKAAQESAVMLAEGNREGSAQAKARQVMNYYLGMAAADAKAETIKIVDRMGRYRKKQVQQEIQKAGNGYWEQIVKVLGRFEFRKAATLRSVDEVNENINIWANERIEIDGDALVLTPAVLDESYVTHWKNVPYTELQGINDSVRNMEHVARYSNKMTRMGEEIEFKKLVDRWVTSMNEAVPDDRFVAKRTDVVEGRKWGRWFMAQMTKIPYMASWLDGGERTGISHQILVQPMTEAYNAEIKLWEEVGSVVMDAIADRRKEDRKRHNRKIHIPEIDDTLYGHQVLAVALNTGNEGNLRKLLLGEGWADPDVPESISLDNRQLQAVLQHMTASDWQLVQLIWDQMDKLYPMLAEVHRRTTGLTPPKVEATPVQTQFGEFRGGYYPVKYDPNRDQRAQENEDKLNAETESMFSNSASIQASVNASATNERTGYYAPMRLSIDVVPAHFQETIHYITHHDPVREINKLIRNKQVSQTITEKIGREEFAQLKPWLNDIAKDGREAPTKMFWDDMLGRLRFGTTLGVMGFKASTGIIQISGLSNSIAELGFAPVYQSLRSILGSTTDMRNAWEFAVENSNVMEHRANTMDREIKNAMQRLENKRGVLAAAQEASMKHIALIQTYMVDLPSWHAAYIKGMDQWGDEQRAFQYADWVVENVQGSGATKDLARIMRNQTEAGRMFTMFMTFFSSLWNMQRDLVKGARSGLYSTTDVAAKAMFLFSVPVLFDMMMRGELGEPEDDEDTRLQQYLTNVALFPIQTIPFVRDVASATIGDFGYNISPMAQILEQGTQTIPEIVTRGFTDEEITKGQVKGATKFIGAATGVPGVSQAWATGEHLHDVLVDGEEFTVHQLLFGPRRD